MNPTVRRRAVALAYGIACHGLFLVAVAFMARGIMTGMESGEFVEILAGISEGDEIVTSAQFLIDSEASIAGSIKRLDSVSHLPEERKLEAVFGSGRVDAVDREARRIRISHGPIEALGWPSMTMTFNVRPSVDLGQVEAGQDIRFALLQEHAGEYGIDPQRLALTGASAGGHLACLAAVTPEDANPEAKNPLEHHDTHLKAVAVFFPITDFMGWGGANPDFARFGPLLFSDGIQGRSDEEIENQAKRISPAHQVTSEPLLKDLIHNVMRDESRHVAFGVLSLRDHYQDMAPNELKDREDFIIYACELMRDRLVGSQIADAMGWPKEEVGQVVLQSPVGLLFRKMLFARVVPNLKRLGLVTPRVRSAFEKLEIIEFENHDPDAQDREFGFA